ncbi:hypothetical protein N7445_001082 [Penicillium cf. griseofulvum]|nr:hypothetical protein N7445_001082 [Penicillium cf. griseofulvum]
MKNPLLWAVTLLWSLYIDGSSAAVAPWSMTWASGSFGPDGPWQAVEVSIGGNDTKVALYPGGSWASTVLLSTICDNTAICYADSAGVFDIHNSSTYDDTSIYDSNAGEWSDMQLGYTNAAPIKAVTSRALDSMDLGGTIVQSADLTTVSDGYQTYPNGNHYPLEVGVLSLGCPDINQTFTRDAPLPPINGTFANSYLYDKGKIPSYSYGMHIGSASFGISGSLKLGGYDQGRVFGDVSAQPVDSGKFPIELIDIGIGVAKGGSPWKSSNMTGLLAQSNSSLASGFTVAVDPANPYIYLPQSSCDAIAANLPVTYNPGLGLYFWDTADAQYTKIVTSPSYLGFTFTKNGVNTEDITIKVPFALLNLTLEAPLVNTPTQYFPCMATNSTPALGRAFLQAAFVGVNWSKKSWFLAQAPGPDYSYIQNVVDISDSDTAIKSSGNSWEPTWENTWTVLAPTNSSTTNLTTSTTTGSTGLSTGAKAGIGAGCGIAALAAVAAACWFIYHRRQKYKRTPSQDSAAADLSSQQPPLSIITMAPVEAPDTKPSRFHELDSDRAIAFPPTSTQTSEYGQSTQQTSQSEQSVQNMSEHSQASRQGPYELSTR